MTSVKDLDLLFKNSTYHCTIPYKLQFDIKNITTQQIVKFGNLDSIFNNISDIVDIDKYENNQEKLITNIESFKNETTKVLIGKNKELTEYANIDSTIPLMEILSIQFERFFEEPYFRLGVNNSDSFYHSILSVIDDTFYFKSMDDRCHIIKELKKCIKIDLSEKNLYSLYKFGRKRWSRDSIIGELDGTENFSIKSVVLLENYFNKNILIYNANSEKFEDRDCFYNNKDTIFLISHYDKINNVTRYEPVLSIDIKMFNWNNENHRNFLLSIPYIKKYIYDGCTSPNLNINTDSKKHLIPKAKFSKQTVDTIKKIIDMLKLGQTKIINGVIKNKTKIELISDIIDHIHSLSESDYSDIIYPKIINLL